MEIDIQKLIGIIEPMVPIFSKGNPEDFTSCVIFKQIEWPKMKLFATSMFTTMIVDVEFDGVGKSWRSGVAYTDMIDFAVNGRVLLGLISKLTSSKIRFKHDKKKPGWITISSATSTYELQYYEIQKVSSSVTAIPNCTMQTTDRGAFIEAIHYGGRFNSTNESTGVMSGVSVIISDDAGMSCIECNSTDSKRLARFKRTTQNKSVSPTKFVISRSQADQIKDILTQYDEPIFEIGKDSSRIYLKTNKYSLTMSAMNFEPLATVDQIIGMQFDKRVTLDRKKTLEALSRLERVQNDEHHRIIIEFGSVTTIRKADIAVGVGIEIITGVATDLEAPIEAAFSHFNIQSAINAFDKCESVDILLFLRGGEVNAVKIESKNKKSVVYVASPVSLGKAKGI